MDPRDLGADCDNCPLKGQHPVAPSQVAFPVPRRLSIVAETPASEEVKRGEFLQGPTGRLWKRRILAKTPIPPRDIHVSNTLLCWAQGLTTVEWKQAVKCCRPRLARELQAVGAPVLAMGAWALTAITGRSGIQKWAGAKYEGRAFAVGGEKRGTIYADFRGLIAVFPTFHPALCLPGRKPAYLPVIRIHHARAWAWVEGRLPDWKWLPSFVGVTEESLQALVDIHDRSTLPVSIDIETGGTNPFAAIITCIGACDGKVAVSVPWHTYSMAEGVAGATSGLAAEIAAKMRAILVQPRLKVGQFFIYDRMGLRAHGEKISGPYWDTREGHRLIATDLPHDESFQMCVESNAPRWKEEFR